MTEAHTQPKPSSRRGWGRLFETVGFATIVFIGIWALGKLIGHYDQQATRYVEADVVDIRDDPSQIPTPTVPSADPAKESRWYPCDVCRLFAPRIDLEPVPTTQIGSEYDDVAPDTNAACYVVACSACRFEDEQYLTQDE